MAAEKNKKKVSVHLENARKIVAWMKENNTTRPPRILTKKVPKEEGILGKALYDIRQNLIKPYKKLKTEQQIEKYRKRHPEIDEVMEIVENIDRNNAPPMLRNARKIVEWMEKNNTTKPPRILAKNVSEEEGKLGYALNHIKSSLVKPYKALETEEQRQQFREKHPEIDEVMEIMERIDKNNEPTHLRNAKKIVGWMKLNNTTKPPRFVNKKVPEEEGKLGSALNHIKYVLIKPYKELQTDQEREEYRKNNPELDEVMKIMEDIEKNNEPSMLRNARKIVEWMEKNNTTKPPRLEGKNASAEEKKLGGALSHIRQDLIKPYKALKTEEEREQYREKHPEIDKVMEIIENIDKNNASAYLINARKIAEWMEKNNTTKSPKAQNKNNSKEEKFLAKALSRIRVELIRPYKELKTEEEREEFREKRPEIDEVIEILLEKKLIASPEKQNELNELVNQNELKRKTLNQARNLAKQYRLTKDKNSKDKNSKEKEGR